ncbi:MAG TPA: Ig-like domain-containing protein [Bryobacteraceae bacterium]|nr:Ig-like domain-containing protein [Bryobacteraceae bacterium]
MHTPKTPGHEPAASGWSSIALSLILIAGVASALQGQTLQLVGTVNVRDLPSHSQLNGRFKHHLFYVGDADAFKQKKSAAEFGALSEAASPVHATASSVAVGPGTGFDGLTFDDTVLGAVPPDTQVAAGAGFVVEAVNIDIRIWNMNVSPPAVTTIDLFSLFGALFSDLISDPRIRFDPVAQRWYISCVTVEQTFVNPPQGDFRLAVSPGSDPTQSFALYAATTINTFPDFPHLGFNEDKLVLTGNSYSLPVSSTSQFQGTEFLVARKSDLLNSSITSPKTQFFAAPQGLDSISPADSLSPTCSGGVCPLYMAAVPDASLPPPADILRIWSLQGVPGVGAGVTFTTTDLNIPLVSIPPGAIQQGSANLIDTNDARLLDAVYRNGSLWVTSNTGCQPSGDNTTRACLHFSQVNTSPISLAQDFVVGQTGEYLYFPAIQTDTNNNLVAVFNRSSATEYPSIYVSGQPAGAAPGTFATPVSVLEGQFPLTPSSATFNRWGDYSGAAVDSNGTTVWVSAEYVHSAANDDWGTWLAPVTLNGAALTPTTTTVASSLNPSSFGQTVTFTATVTGTGGTPTGTVTFKDGAATLGSGGLNPSGQATFATASLAAGPHSITAAYGGDSNFASSTSSNLPQTVNQAVTTTTVSSNLNPSTFGQTVTFTATVTSSGGTPTGTVTFMDGATTLGSGVLNASGHASFSTASLAAGPHSISATYGGSANFAGSASSNLPQTVNQAGTTTTVSSSANPSILGQMVTFTATVTSAGGTPTGTVTFKDGATVLTSSALNGSGQATFSTSTLATGSHSITAAYAGTVNFASSVSGVLNQTVNQQAATTTSLASSLNPSKSGQTVTFTATVTSGAGTPAGSVTFKDGTTILNTLPLNASGQASFATSALTVGTHSITAVYGGNLSFLGSVSPVVKQVVKKH